MNLLPVPLEYVNRLKPIWYPFLEGVSKGTGFPVEDHAEDVLNGEVIPLLAMDDKDCHALAGARIEVDGKGRHVCHIVWCTGSDRGIWFDLLDDIERWAREHMGCVGMKATARPGWSKAMKAKGYTTSHVVVEKEFV